MSLNYTLIVDVDDAGLLSPPFTVTITEPDLYDRVWIDRGEMINRYSGQMELVIGSIGFGVGDFGNGVFGWS